MIDESKRCTARSKRTGKRCRRPVTPGKKVCYYHGGASTGPKTPEGKARSSLNGLIHGIYVKRLLNEEEQRLYEEFVDQIRQDFELNRSSDEIAVVMAAMSFVQYVRALRAGKESAAETFERMIRNGLRDLKATKIAREGETVSPQTSPAEWAAAILDKIRAADQKAKGKSKSKRKADRGKTQK